MNFEQIENAIRSRWYNNVQLPQQITTYHDNQDVDDVPSALWCRVTVLPGQSEQVSLGSQRRFRTPGVMIVQVFQKVGLGTKSVNELIDEINSNFRGVSIVGMTFRTPSVQKIGEAEGWYQVNITCPFYSDDVET
jgi:hypothetical protein